MKISFKNWLSLVFVFISYASSGQILDDTTKDLYSHKTVVYRLDENMISNYGAYKGDTSLNEFSTKGDFLYQKSGIYQNLGVFGTIAHPLYYRLPTSIGLRNGMNGFDYLIPSKDEVKYYNTLSPYTVAHYTQGAKQRARLGITFSQNILPGLNIAAHYQRLTALRTFNITQSDERVADHHSAYISSNYSDSSGRYKAWAHYQHLNHLQYETGGINFRNFRQSYLDSLFEKPEIYPAQLDMNARNRELRNNWYFSQVLKPFRNALYVRTSHYRFKQVNSFNDPKPNLSYYGDDLYFQKKSDQVQADTLVSERTYRLWENTVYVGVQDSSVDLSFYIRRRDIVYHTNLFTFNREKTEYVYGGQFSGRLGPGQTQITGEWIGPKEFDLRGIWKWAGFNAGARLFVFKPSLIQTEFISKDLLYLNDFVSTKAIHLSVSQNVAFGKWKIVPGFEHYSVVNGIAFGDDFKPFQSDGNSTMQMAKIQLIGQLGKVFHTENQFVRVFQSGARISQMPTYMYHSAHWFDVYRKRKGYGIQLGFNLDWRYDWPSESYNPLTGQWFLQNKTTIAPYTLLDVFMHIRIDRVRVYMKVHNTLQGVGSPGYYAAPNYQAQRRLFEIGLVWTFFD